MLHTYNPILMFHFINDKLSEYLMSAKIENLFNRKMYFQLGQISSVLLMCNDSEEDLLPASLVLGGVEIFVGVLVAILPFPYAREAGLALILDGAYRAFNGMEEMDEQNKSAVFGTETEKE